MPGAKTPVVGGVWSSRRYFDVPRVPVLPDALSPPDTPDEPPGGCRQEPPGHEARILAHAERVAAESHRERGLPPPVAVTTAERKRADRRREAARKSRVPEAVWYRTPLGDRQAVVKLVNCGKCRRVLCGESMRAVKGRTAARLPPLVAGRVGGRPFCGACLPKGKG